MPLEIVRNDITKMSVDAIVNAANTTLLGGGGVDGAIHRAAGPQLLEECRTLHGCRTGEAKITHGYRLPCKYVIHTAGPIWQDGHHGERELLTACYRNSLELADKYHCESVAFPLISSGVYGYPKAQALKVAMDTITQFLLDHDMTVYIVVFSKDAFEVSSKLFKDIEAYIDDVYVDERLSAPSESMRIRLQRRYLEKAKATEAEPEECCAPSMASDARLDDMLSQVDESFAQMLIRKIDERHMTDVQCYKRANVDRRLFNKIKNIPDYKPSKQTALAFAIALELSLDETKDKIDWNDEVPDSLTDAIYTFYIANAIRDLRNDRDKHRSMLINMSRFTKVQYRIRDKVEAIDNAARRAIQFNLSTDTEQSLQDPILNRIHEMWEKHYSDLEFNWEDIAAILWKAVEPIEIRVVNSSRNSDKLVYPKDEAIRVIAIGGLALSRGLTLEGLIVSYFYRNTCTYDVLMQMGRWFGYRKNYEDIFRIWTSRSSAAWYSEIADATEQLKRDIQTFR